MTYTGKLVDEKKAAETMAAEAALEAFGEEVQQLYADPHCFKGKEKRKAGSSPTGMEPRGKATKVMTKTESTAEKGNEKIKPSVAPRTLVSEDALTGSVVVVKCDHGFIQPDTPIEHDKLPDDGNIYFSF